MRKTLKRNLSYDDRNHLSCVSLYCDGEGPVKIYAQIYLQAPAE